VERCRLFTAVIASAAGLAPSTPRDFHRGPRGIEVPELAIRPRVLPRWVPPVGLAASVAALVLVFGVRWSTAIAVSAVFVCHELAHAGVMRLVGAKVRGFLFVPLLGAATVPEHGFRSRWDEARVTLAGPASGLPTAGIIAMFLVSDAEWIGRGPLGFALLVALAVNVVNLVPLLPLDGGRILTCLCAGLPHGARVALTLAPLVLAAVLAVALIPGSGLVVVLVFLGVSVATTRVTLRRQKFLVWMESLPQPLAEVRAALRDVTNGFNGRAREDVDGGVAATPLSRGQVGVVLGLWIAEAIALAVATAVFLSAYPWVVETLGPDR
jgi:Zn-dependent protease